MDVLQEEEEALARYALRVLRQRGHLGEAAIKQCPVEAILQYNTQAADCLLQLLRAEILTLVRLSIYTHSF